MDCNTFREHIKHASKLDDAAVSHSVDCTECEAWLTQGLPTRGPGTGEHASDLEGGLSAARALVQGDTGVVAKLRARSLSLRVLIGLGCLGVATLAAQKRPLGPELAFPFSVVSLGMASFLWPLQRRISTVTQIAAAWLAVVTPLGFAFWASQHPSVAPERPLLPCLAWGASVGLLFVGLLIALDRGALRDVGRAVIAGATAGLAANALLHVHCPSDALAHLLLGHSLLALPLIGALWLRSRRGSLSTT